MDGLAQAIQKMKQMAQMQSQSCEQEESSTKCEFNECDGSGWVRGEKGLKPCKCYIKKRNEDQLKYSGLLKIKEHYAFSNYKTDKPHQERAKQTAINYTKEILNKSTDWLLALGQSGAGKTHLCSAVCFKAINSGMSVRYVPYREMINELKRYMMDDYEYRKIMDPYKRCNLLYLDDLFKGKITESDINIVYELINYRYNNDKATIVSSELSINKLNEIDNAIAGRMIERSGKNLIIFNDKEMNYRLNGGKG